MAKRDATAKAKAEAKAAVMPATGAVRSAARTVGLKVRALEAVFYDNVLRRAGDVFTIGEKAHFSKRAMEYVDPQTPEKVTGAQAALSQEHQRIQREVAGVETPGADNPTGTDNVLE